MKSSTALGAAAAILGGAAVGAGLSSSYQGAEAALMGMGLVLALRSILAATPVRQWAPSRRAPKPETGPVTSMVDRIQAARKGSNFSQAYIAGIIREARPGALGGRGEALVPSESWKRLKGRRYVSELQAALGVEEDA